MSQKNLFIILGIIIVLSAGFFLAFSIMTQKGATQNGVPSNPFANFFPFGQSPSPNPSNQTSSNSNTTTTNNLLVAPITNPLRQISSTPTAGLYVSVRQGKTYARYVEKETGNVYETQLDDMQKNRLSNATIEGVHEAFFGNSGKNAVMRFLQEPNDTIISFILDVMNPIKTSLVAANVGATSTTSATPNGSFLPQNISDMIVSRDTNSMFYLTHTGTFAFGKSVGTIYSFQKKTSLAVFQSLFTEWLPVYFDGSTILLQTKASQSVEGQLYSLNTSTGSFQKIFGNINGLTTLPSPDGQKILYSASSLGSVSLYIYNRKDASNLKLSLKTLPEKCVWGKDNATLYCAATNTLQNGAYPDDWYQGAVSFDDNLWKIDSKTGEVTSVLSPTGRANQSMDMTNLTLTPNEDYVVFINKKDSSLWMFDLAGT